MRATLVTPRALLSLAVRAGLTVLFVSYGGGRVAQRFGFQQVWGLSVALLVLAIADMALLLARELPRQGPPFLFRFLMIWVWVVGWLAILWSAMQIRYDRWAIFYASLHVLFIIGLVLVVGWVSAGRAMTEIVFGRPAKQKRNPSSSVDDRWLD